MLDRHAGLLHLAARDERAAWGALTCVKGPGRGYGFAENSLEPIGRFARQIAGSVRNPSLMQRDLQIDCEFTLALNNRTGKYFLCRDMIEACADLISRQLFWRLPSAKVPPRTMSRILGRLARIEVSFRTQHPWTYRVFPAMRGRRPVFFTDPRECVLYRLRRYDVVLCHDMGPITHPELYAPGVREIYSAAFERIKAARPLIIFVSEASKNDFIRLYGDDFPLLAVAHPPIRSDLDDAEEEEIPNLPSRFLLTVGSIGARKNHARAIAAYAMSGLADEGCAYVICGGPEPGAEAVEAAARDTKGVHLCGYVNDRQLRWLYRHARGFVLPSILEGFGLPAAEAINRALVPLVGAGGALHEVTGDSAVLVDPLDVGQIAAGMRTLV
ncbi:glycosyltransferase family 1 protein, partial [Bradyrhizobium sp.]